MLNSSRPEDARQLAVFMLTRQRFPASAPQSIQLLSTAHGLAQAGVDVTMCVDPPLNPTAEVAVDREHWNELLLSQYGLEPIPTLHLIQGIYRNKPAASLHFNLQIARWIRRVSREGKKPVFFSRSEKYAVNIMRWMSHIQKSIPLVFEWHYLRSANEWEQGQLQARDTFRRLETNLLRMASGHVVVSQALAACLNTAQGLETQPTIRSDWMPVQAPTGPLMVLPNGGPSVTEVKDAKTSISRLIYAGLFRRPQDFNVLLDAMTLLPAEIQIEVLGSDEEQHRFKQVQTEVERRGLKERVHLVGAVPPLEARDRLRKADIAIATFADSINMQHFASPLKILEYQAAGMALISTDHPTVRELVEDGENGLLVPWNRPDCLADAVMRLYTDGALRARLSAGARRSAQARTWARRGERLRDFLQSI